METEDVVINLQEDNSFTLNCTYKKGTEIISDGGIMWQKQINGTFKNIAFFSKAGGIPPFFEKEMKTLYENRTELIGPNTSLSAVMIIKDPVCTDEGTYNCLIRYFDEGSEEVKADSSVVVFNCKYIHPTKYRILRIYQTHSIILSTSLLEVNNVKNGLFWKNFYNCFLTCSCAYEVQ